MRLSLLFVVSATASCLSDLSIAPNATMTCSSSSECPGGFVCEAGRCEDADGNRPPRLAMTLPPRAVDTITASVTVFDGNSDQVSLVAEIVDGQDIHVVAPEPATINAKADGTSLDVIVPAPTLADGTLPRVVTLRLTASDGIRTSVVEADVTYGNQAPVIVGLSAPNVDGGSVGGVVELSFVAQDSSADSFDITGFAFAVGSGDFVDVPLEAPSFEVDQLTGLDASVAGLPRVLSWNTDGKNLNDDVIVRLTVNDAFGGETIAESGPIHIDNRPQVTHVSLGDDGGRPLELQDIVVDVVDPNGGQVIALTLEHALDYNETTGVGTFAPLTDSGILTDVAEHTTFTWDLAADLPTALIATTAHPDGEEVLSLASVVLRVSARDASGLASAPVIVGPFAVGDDPPALTFTPPSSGAGGAVAVSFTLADASLDDSSIEVQFRQNPRDQWRSMRVLAGITDRLPTTQTPTPFLVLWDSLATINDDVSVPQGIGRQLLPDVGLRMRSFDEPRTGERRFSAWQEATVALSNQSAPRIEPVFVGEQGGVRSGVLPIVWRATDEESDVVRVQIEFSTDGVRFSSCTEARTPHSEGLTGLGSAPAAAGGVDHTFLWDVASDVIDVSNVEVRARIADPFTDIATARPATLVSTAPWDPAPGHEALFAPLDLGDSGGIIANVDVGDFNGDGRADIVVGTSGTMTLRRGDGGGGFTQVASLSNSTTPRFVDFNHDGHLDIAFDDGTVIVGNGRDFSVDNRISAYACSGFCTALNVDIDGDGLADVILEEQGATRLLTGRGAGDDFALIEGDVVADSSFRSTAVGDVDGDGTLELVRIRGTPKAIEIWRLTTNDAGVTLATLSQSIASTPPRNDLQLVAVTDMTGDGHGDVVALDPRLGSLLLYKSEGSPVTLTEVARVSTGTFPMIQPRSADINQDNVADFVVPTLTENDVVVVFGRQENGRPGGGFVDPVRLPVGDVQGGVAIGDIDGNGKDDIVAGVGLGGRNHLLLAFLQPSALPLNAASFSAPRPVTGPGLANASAKVADVDADGALDLVLSSEFGTPTIARGRRTGALTTSFDPGPLPIPGGAGFPQGFAVADLDNDGRVDVVGWQPDDRGGCFFESYVARSDGAFAPIEHRLADRCSLDVGVGDVNGDGIVDLAAAALTNGHAWALYFGNGDGTFTVVDFDLDTPGGFVEGHAIDDLDNDGFGDVVVTPDQNANDTNPLQVAVYKGRADRNLSGPLLFNIVGGGARVRIADVDDDGFADILLLKHIGFGSDHVQVLRGSGIGRAWTIAERVTSSAVLPGGQRFRPAISDVDNDGLIDISWSQPAPGRVLTVLPGLGAGVGNGQFGAPLLMNGARNLGDLVSVDVSGDGQPDLVSSEYFGGAATVSLGRRSGGLGGVSRAIVADDSSGAQAFGFGIDTVTIVNGVVEAPSILVRRVAGADDILAGVPAGTALGEGGDFARLLSRDHMLVGRHHRPLTGAFFVAGDVALRRVTEPADGVLEGGTRLRITPRLGTIIDPDVADGARVGLDLNGADARGVIVDLPFLQGRVPAGTVKVFVRVPRWRTADLESSADPLASSPLAAEFLPRVAGEDGVFNDVVLVDYDWLVVPEGDGRNFTDDSTVGPRFHVDVSQRRVRVLLDHFGAIEAFDLP